MRNNRKFYLMLDVGGTNIKAGILSENGVLEKSGIRFFEAKAKGSQKEIFKNFAEVLHTLMENLPEKDARIEGIGMAFPGPFDYEKGVSLMRGLGKYDSIYGLSIPEEMKRYFLSPEKKELLAEKCRFIFLHDVEAFAIGECHFGEVKNCKRVMHLCIGTGAGSAFTSHGKILKGEEGAPPMGWIFNTPFRESIIDDYLSVRGLAAVSRKVLGEEKSGRELAELCQRENARALTVYEEFGDLLQEAALPFLDSFGPDGFVLGGQMSKSFSYFGGALSEECEKRGIKIFLTADTSRRALEGLYVYARDL